MAGTSPAMTKSENATRNLAPRFAAALLRQET
jgi:hypothetical protein